MNRRRVVVTGLGVVAPGGVGAPAFWNLLSEGRAATWRLSLFGPGPYRSQVAAEVDFDPYANELRPPEVRRKGRAAQFAVLSTRQAVGDSGIDLDRTDPCRLAVAFGSAVGGSIGLEIAKDVDAQGPGSLVSTGCSPGIDVLGYATRLIRDGWADVVVTGAAGVHNDSSECVGSGFGGFQSALGLHGEPRASTRRSARSAPRSACCCPGARGVEPAAGRPRSGPGGGGAAHGGSAPPAGHAGADCPAAAVRCRGASGAATCCGRASWTGRAGACRGAGIARSGHASCTGRVGVSRSDDAALRPHPRRHWHGQSQRRLGRPGRGQLPAPAGVRLGAVAERARMRLGLRHPGHVGGAGRTVPAASRHNEADSGGRGARGRLGGPACRRPGGTGVGAARGRGDGSTRYRGAGRRSACGVRRHSRRRPDRAATSLSTPNRAEEQR
ncbi:beta-ketoacyl synthase N-terminal-like domain-containing protein [Lentzea sp.]|uniref:beta-ketoacyl synthase N-terminal-like domain-containing protein n=1 Tax=Lentzea sp. TaxID=56099 RepID=UPI0039C98B40